MGWKEAQNRYRECKTLADQKVEDLVARRVLQGLGHVQRDLVALEFQLFGHACFDDAIWPRVKQVLMHIMRNNGYGRLFDEWHIEVCDTTPTHKDVLERIQLGPSEGQYPLFLTRIKDTTTSLAYSLRLPDELVSLVPPFNVIDTYNDRRIVIQDTAHFIAQYASKA